MYAASGGGLGAYDEMRIPQELSLPLVAVHSTGGVAGFRQEPILVSYPQWVKPQDMDFTCDSSNKTLKTASTGSMIKSHIDSLL